MVTRVARVAGLLFFSHVLVSAASFTFSGLVTQSTADGTGPAVSNSSLNNILDLQTYSVTLTSAVSVSGPGTYDLSGATLAFTVPGAPASESSFGAISLTLTSVGGTDQFSLLACVTTGPCLQGNELTANFALPSGSLNGSNIAATALDLPHPLELLEDGGSTDIHGSITSYSGSGFGQAAPAPVPEPSSILLLGSACTALLLARHRRAQ